MREERGGVSLVVVTGALVLCAFALCAADLGALLLARAKAQAAADAAALAAVVQQVPALAGGESPQDAARAEAEANGATLVGCECEVGTPSSTVRVEVHPLLVYVAPWFGLRATASATASVDPDVLSYRAG